MSHFIKICKKCKGVINQCRCIGDKEKTYGICDECKLEDIKIIKPKVTPENLYD